MFAQSHGFTSAKIVEGVLNPTILNDTGNLFFIYSILTFIGENGTQVIEWKIEIPINVGQSDIDVISTRNVTVSVVHLNGGYLYVVTIYVSIILVFFILCVTCVLKRRQRV